MLKSLFERRFNHVHACDINKMVYYISYSWIQPDGIHTLFFLYSKRHALWYEYCLIKLQRHIHVLIRIYICWTELITDVSCIRIYIFTVLVKYINFYHQPLGGSHYILMRRSSRYRVQGHRITAPQRGRVIEFHHLERMRSQESNCFFPNFTWPQIVFY